MTTPTERLNKAADRLDHLYEGAKHIPTDLEHNPHAKGLVAVPELPNGSIRPVAKFYDGGAAEVFLALGPAVLPDLARWLRAEVKNVEMTESIHGLLSRDGSEVEPQYVGSVVTALAFADRVLKTEES